MKVFFRFLFIILLGTASVFASGLEEGYYKGETIFKDKVELHLKSNPARPGSFLALVVNEGGYGFIYQVDKYSDDTFGMVPLTHKKENMLTIQNASPSLVLKVSKQAKKSVIKIMNNGDENDYGFKYSAMTFEVSKRKSSIWSYAFNGIYEYDNNRERVTVNSTSVKRDYELLANTTILNGEYVLREVRSGIYLPLRKSLTMAGTQLDDEMEGMVVFINDKNLLGSNGVYLLNYIGTVKLLEFKKGLR